jgi:hypothetical protein
MSDTNEDVLTVEEHTKKLNIDTPTFEGVMKASGWKPGEKVSEANFKKAVDAYLEALKKKKPGLPTVEEHAANLKIDAPVFAAVMQSNKWASGKRVPVSVFEKAVKDFEDAPMGGK